MKKKGTKKIDYKMIAEFLYDLFGYQNKELLSRLVKRYGGHYK